VRPRPERHDSRHGQVDKTAENEPMLMVISYGKGRVFHTTLGHDEESMKDVGLW